MTYCSVKYCHNTRKRNRKPSNITFHAFPSDPVVAARWVDIIRLNRKEECWKPNKNTIICSVHFDESEKYITKNGYSKLHRDAVPTKGLHIFCTEESHCSNNTLNDTREFVVPQQVSQNYTPDYNVVNTNARGPSHSTVGTPDASDLAIDDDDNTTEHNFKESIIDDVLAPDDYYIPTATHIGYVCGACGNRIDGFRYACVQCEDYDQCAECEASGAHAEHYVLRVPRVERATEHETVLGRVRRELKQVNISVELKLEKDDAAEKSIVIKEEVMEPEDVDPLRGAGVGAGDGAVKQEVIDPEHNAMTATGQVPVSGPSPTGEASHTEAGAGGASRPEVVDQSPEMLWMGAGGGAVKQEAVVSDDDSLTFDRFQFTEATGAHLRTYEASRRRAVASEPVSPSAATGEASSRGGAGAAAHSRLSAELTVAGRAERPRRAAASRDARLSELAFDSKRAPRKRRKVEESGD